ncbi:M3 family oligoendopeptidase [Candidatus Bipolaricaulota bacterium]|nr:M3 family oligoendopeptidase [Candidatus Bipolaricaulota bacterium]
MSETRYQPGRWALSDLIPAPDGPAMDALFSQLEEAVSDFEYLRDALSPSIEPATFDSALQHAERVGYLTRQLNGYATLWLSELTSHSDALAFRSCIDKTLAEAQNRILFFELWWKELDAENTSRLMETSGDLRYYLESLRRFTPYTLSEAEEKIINIKDVNGVNGHLTMYDMLTNDFTYDVEVDDEVRTVTRTEISVMAHNADPNVRAAAYRALNKVFAEHGGVLGQLYSYVVGDWNVENVSVRGMPSAISARNLINDIPDDVVDALLVSCQKNAALYHRYFGLKANWLDMKVLRRYDIYAPIGDANKTIPFAEGVNQVLETMAAFSPMMAELAERVVAENHLDSEVRVGKDTGAFCYGVVPDKTPWVLVNYNNRLDDVSTLGHELGHAIHSMLAAAHSPLTFRSSLPLAETASNFVEILLLKRWLSEETDPRVGKSLLAKFVDDSYASILRQSYFVLFEREAHQLIEGGGATVEQLSATYLENLKDQFGDSIELSDDFRWEWTSIPHNYHVPFYCYAYAFGLLLVLSLYRQYEREGDAFVPKYLKILSYGGSVAPIDILDEAGFDIRNETFWQRGFDVIREMIGELEDLTNAED